MRSRGHNDRRGVVGTCSLMNLYMTGPMWYRMHVSAMNPDGFKGGAILDIDTVEIRDGESTSKSPEPKRKEDIFLEQCVGKIEDSSDKLIQVMKSSDKMRMTLLLSVQQTMMKLVEKL